MSADTGLNGDDTRLKLAILDDYVGVARDHGEWSRIEDRVAVTLFNAPIPADDLAERLAPFDIICAMRERTRFDAALLNALPNLKLLVTSGLRNAAIDLSAAAARSLPVSGTEAPGHATAELTMGLLLAAARRIPAEVIDVAAGGWQTGVGRDLKGASLGLIGLGKLGGRVAGYAQAFGMTVRAWSANLTDARAAEVGVARAPSLEDLIAGADMLSIHLRLGDRSRGLLGAAALVHAKPDAILVNTSRGPIVDLAAVLGALEAGRLGVACLDVHDEEPLPAGAPARSRALITAGKLIPTPHLGYATRETYDIYYGQSVESVEAWLNGAPVRLMTP